MKKRKPLKIVLQIFSTFAGMKQLLILLFVTLLLNPLTAQVKIKHLPIKKVEKMDYVLQDIEEPNCSDVNDDGATEAVVLFEFSGVAPDATDAKKTKVIEKLDNWMKQLKAFADCEATHTIIIKLAEGTFLKESDDFEPYSKAYFKKGYALAAKRFKERYEEQLGKLLKGKTIILTDWNW
tara:strand:- start:46 stop:585 length:540 start_codon:yes stop_codon:yes gene_type:complete